ncbi:MAG: DUF2007 domain-containing protein [Flavobacteriaceae bacterium]|nr:DUF2007 domain-containing protein [Flavobacteriaceae bacterium]
MTTQYQRIYTGSFIIVTLIVSKLEEIGITPIVKDETESGRLAGFGPSVPGQQQIFVHDSNIDRAVPIVETVLSDIHV